MSSNSPLPRRSLASLKKEAKRWLDALRSGPADSPERVRFERALPNAPPYPRLRDVQLALAREHGFTGWTALKTAIEQEAARDREAGAHALAYYEAAAEALLEAFRTGTPDAMERHYGFTWHRRAWQGMRRYVQLDLGHRLTPDDPDPDISLADAQYLVAREHGFTGWDDLEAFTARARGQRRLMVKPMQLGIVAPDDELRPLLRTRDWDELLDTLATTPGAVLGGERQITDAMLKELAARVEHVEALELWGCPITDEGLRSLAGLPRLNHLNLGGTAITDDGLAFLASIPALRAIALGGTRTTDAGAAHLAKCDNLERVELQGTRTGDGAIRALAGKDKLRWLATGHLVTDDGLALLHELPQFKTWRGSEPKMVLLGPESEPNYLLLRGTFGDKGLRHLRGLDGLFGLNVDDARLAITAEALEPLTELPHLGRLAVDAKDDWMPAIARMPALRYLIVQDTSAGDDGFAALSESRSIEYIWGRRCHNLGTRGFMALSRMPSLRGLSVSCLNVEDTGIAALPDFPALRELMPMDVPDEGYRHIGRCDRLDSLILMYCRDTTDRATEHITGLSRLTYYFNSYTTITDRTPELLSGMESLERITFDTCHNLTNAGIAHLARLPRLGVLRVSARGVTADVAKVFRPEVSVSVD